MKKILLLVVMIAISCGPPHVDRVISLDGLPGLEGCTMVEFATGRGHDVYIVRCPNGTTAASTMQGKTENYSVDIEEDDKPTFCRDNKGRLYSLEHAETRRLK